MVVTLRQYPLPRLALGAHHPGCVMPVESTLQDICMQCGAVPPCDRPPSAWHQHLSGRYCLIYTYALVLNATTGNLHWWPRFVKAPVLG